MTIVSDLQKLQTAFFDENFERGGASINSVFYELFQGMHWCNNNLSGSDFVDNIWVKSLKTIRSVRGGENLGLTLILLGAVTTERSSAFLLVPLGDSVSISMSSIFISRALLYTNLGFSPYESSGMRRARVSHTRGGPMPRKNWPEIPVFSSINTALLLMNGLMDFSPKTLELDRERCTTPCDFSLQMTWLTQQ